MFFTSIEAKDFISFANLHYDFLNISVLIQGINKTDDGQESNGSGKTAFQAIIEYCLYGSTSLKIRDKDLIRHGQNKAYLALYISCPQRNEVLRIERFIYKSKSAQLQLFINDNPCSFATVNDGNNLIINWIKISKEDLQNYYIINKERYKSFFQASQTEKVNLISRFTNGLLVDNTNIVIDEQLNLINNKIADMQGRLAQNLGKKEAYINVLNEQTKDSWELKRKEQLNALNEELVGIDEKIKNYLISIEKNQLDALEKNKEIARIESSILIIETDIKAISFDKIKSQEGKIDQVIKRKKSDIDDFETKYLEKKKQYEVFDKALSRTLKKLHQSVVCPSCHFEFVPDSNIDIVKEKANKAKIEQVLVKLQDLKDQVYKLMESHALELKEYSNKKDQIFVLKQKLYDKVETLNSKIVELKGKRDRLFEQIKMHRVNEQNYEEQIEKSKTFQDTIKTNIQDIKNITYDNSKYRKYKDLIAQCDKSINDSNIELNKLENEKSKQIAWNTNFKKFKVYLANKFLKIIEGVTNKYLEDLKSDMYIQWEGYKIKADSSLSERITAYIYRNGEERDYRSFSGGERARMDISMILTIRELINTSHPYGGLQFLFTDEIFEGLDGLGLSQLMNCLSVFKLPILVTTHVTDRNIHGNHINIVKTNGVSQIESTLAN